MIPGSNLLEEAFENIETQLIQYKKFNGRALNAVGQWVNSYLPDQDVEASVQAVNRNTYQQLGLDFQKNYIQIYICLNGVAITRDSAGDRFLYNGKEYQCDSELSWFEMDGWVGLLAVRL